MATHTLVDKSLQGTRIITDRGAEYGDNLHVAQVVPQEFSSLCAFYPILIAGNPDRAGYRFVAIFGFEPGENLYLEGNQWDAGYVPITVRQQPFLLVPQEIKNEEGNTETVPMLAIDNDSPRVSTERGEPIFDADGEPTEWFRGINQMLSILVEGSNMGRELLRKLDVLELLEPLQMGIRLVDGSALRLEGLHTINEVRLRELSDQAVLELHRLGYLDCIYSMRASLGHLGALARRKNTRGAAG